MYKNGKFYWTSVQIKGKRISASLKTADKKIARTRERQVKIELYNQIKNGLDRRKPDLGNTKLVKAFLNKRKSKWKPTTYKTYKNILEKVWLPKKVFPTNKSTIESYSKHINAFFNWSNKNYKTNYKILKYEQGEARIRVFSDDELDLLFNSTMHCKYYQQIIPKEFLKFAYYTGAREGELLNIESVNTGFMIATGKRGTRIIKLPPLAQDLIKKTDWQSWNWTPDTIQKAFKNYTKELNIKDAMFKDFRRTFGLNYILNGGMIYQLSKLLGHKRVSTTEKHYAPLMAIFIPDEDFKFLQKKR